MPDPMRSYLDFEKPIAELDSKIDELRALTSPGLLEQPVTDPFALGSDRWKLLHKTSYCEGELSLTLSHQIISDLIPAAYDATPRLK